MATLAELIKMRDELEKARFMGTSSVTMSGKSVAYKSDIEMKQALEDLNRKISAASGSTGTPFMTFSTSKGL